MKLFKFISILAVVLLYSCSDSDDADFNLPPTAVFSYVPENADTSTVFTFDASASSDVKDPNAVLLFKWDFEGKHSWTDAVNDPLANYRYTKSGIYEVGLKVIDTEGWSGETTMTVIVNDTL